MEFLAENILLVLLALVSGGMLIWPFIARLISGAKELSAADVVNLINRRDALVVDVREPGEFKSGHIPRARNIPLSQLKDRMKELEKQKARPIVLSCASGSRSLNASRVLKQHGFNEVFALRKGLLGWTEASMPLEK
ncbi:MAG: rhodanese-like domain-containing protein [Burkholderiales bacterium]